MKKEKPKPISLEETRKLLGASKNNRKFVFMHPLFFMLTDTMDKGEKDEK